MPEHPEAPPNRPPVVVSLFKNTASVFSNIVKILFAIVGVIFLLSMIVGLVAGTTEQGTYHDVLYAGTDETIAVIDMNGTILDVVPTGPLDFVTEAQMITPRRVIRILQEITYDDAVVAVILRINSPGGSVTASEEIYQAITRFKQETGIPVIVSQGEMAASGGYYISLAGDTIMADPATLTGSIGVIASMLNLQELANDYGVREIAVTSGDNKNFFSPFQEVNDEERAILQSIIDDAYGQFIARITASRSVDETTLSQLADGRPLTGKQAQDAGFVDELGTLYDAIELARETANHPRAQVVEYTDMGLFESLFGVVTRPLMNKMPFSFLEPYTLLSGKPAYLYGGM